MKNYILSLSILFFGAVLFGQSNNFQPSKEPVFSLKGAAMNGQLLMEGQQVESAFDKTIKLINFNPSLAFTNNNISTLPVNMSPYAKLTIFSVYQSMSEKEMLIWSNSQKGRKSFLTTHQLTGPAGSDFYQIADSGIPMISTVTQIWDANNKGTVDTKFLVGSQSVREVDSITNFEGFIPEVLVYNRAVSKQERAQIETRLALKYGITLKHISYKNSAHRTLWNHNSNKNFTNRVAGIGRDDIGQLYQKKSKSTARNTHLQIGVSRIDSLADQQFFIWGDNDAPFALKDKENSKEKFQYAQRQWKMEVIENNKLPTSTEIQLNFGALNIPKTFEPYLVIAANSQVNERSEDLIYIPATTIKANEIAYFDYNQWDVDQSGSDFFTFAFKPTLLDAKSLRIYPNPSASNVTLDIVLKEATDIRLNIHDASGKTIFSVEEKGKQFYQFKRKFTKKGVYLVEIKTKFGRLTKEVMILE